MQVKALLVNPKFPDTFWGFRHSLPFLGKKATYPPLGLLTVAALLPERWTTRVIDMNAERLEDEDIAWADIVLFTSMLVQRASLERSLERVSAAGKPAVLGGPYASSAKERPGRVDYLVRGEAETSLAAFIADWEAGRAAAEYREAGGKPALSVSPIPRFDLIRHQAYSALSMQFSRGCPFNCDFCDITQLYGRVPRTKPPAQALEELSTVLRLGYRGAVFFVDDNFIGNKQRAKEFLALLIPWQERHGWPLSFHTEASVDLADDPELLALMRRAGFTMVFLGIETPDPVSLAAIGKVQNLRSDPLRSVRRIQEAGIEVSAGFIIGFDDDPPDIADRQIDFIRRSAVPTAMVGLLTALPGTRLARRLEAEGRLREVSSGNNTFAPRLNFVPRADEAQVIASYERVIAEIFRPAAYFRRCAKLLSVSAGSGFHAAGRPRISEFPAYAIALAASLVRQGFSGYGAEYLRFLAIFLARSPRLFPRAVKMAILGHHFFALRRMKVIMRIRRAESFIAMADRAARAIARAESSWRSLGVSAIAKKATALWLKLSSMIARRYTALDPGLSIRVGNALEELGSSINSAMHGIRAMIDAKLRRTDASVRADMDRVLTDCAGRIRSTAPMPKLENAGSTVLEGLRFAFAYSLESARGDRSGNAP